VPTELFTISFTGIYFSYEMTSSLNALTVFSSDNNMCFNC